MTETSTTDYHILMVCEDNSQAKILEAFLQAQNQIVSHVPLSQNLDSHITTQKPDVVVAIADIPDAHLINQIRN